MIDYFCEDLLKRFSEVKDSYVQALERGCLKNMEEYREHIGMINATKQCMGEVRAAYLQYVGPKDKATEVYDGELG
jgi:hypothetical protein